MVSARIVGFIGVRRPSVATAFLGFSLAFAIPVLAEYQRMLGPRAVGAK